MAPSATSEIVVPVSKVDVAKQPEQHVHGAEDKTPLEAISHGPLIHPGMIVLVLCLFIQLKSSVHECLLQCGLRLNSSVSSTGRGIEMDFEYSFGCNADF